MTKGRLDAIGAWTEIKLQIVQDYAVAYAQVLGSQRFIKHVAYIDGFAGAGSHVSKKTGELIQGSPLRALAVRPSFTHYHFVEMNPSRAERLRGIGDRPDVSVYQGDCNDVLLQQVFPQCRYEDYRRALCLLDPYGLNPNWEVVRTAGEMRSIEIFLNFMIMDANMNVLWRSPDSLPTEQASRMTRFWGDDSWRSSSYEKERGLFGPIEEKRSNEAVVAAYRKRLKEVAHFKYVPEPLPMRNSHGATIYYLLFASHNSTGNKIAEYILNKYRGGIA